MFGEHPLAALIGARLVELVDTTVFKTVDSRGSCGFKPHTGHHSMRDFKPRMPSKVLIHRRIVKNFLYDEIHRSYDVKSRSETKNQTGIK